MPFDIQGHRGARGLMPENTIPAFIKAIDLGVTTLELDVVVTKDRQVLISHEPWMNHEICLDSTGNEIDQSDEKKWNIYQMDYSEIQRFDCGSKNHPRFPDQIKMPATKPLLSDMIDAVESYLEQNQLPKVNYNIEIKSDPKDYNTFQPDPSDFSELVFSVLNEKLDWDRVTVQSFDFQILKHFHQFHSEVRLAALVENELPFQENLSNLGFKPEIYSCDYSLLSPPIVEQLHKQGIRVIPWTVNEMSDMSRLISWGVDGLITDYPNRYMELSVR